MKKLLIMALLIPSLSLGGPITNMNDEIIALRKEVKELRAELENVIMFYDVLLRSLTSVACYFNWFAGSWQFVLPGLQPIPIPGTGECFEAGTMFFLPRYIHKDGPAIPQAEGDTYGHTYPRP